MALQPFEIRRQLLNMTTLESITIGRLTIRLMATTASRRWVVDSDGIRQTYSYPLNVEYDWLEGGKNYLSLSNEALSKTVAYILANYQGERALNNGKCPICGDTLKSRKQTYCGPSCRVSAYQKRRKAS